MGSWVSSGLRSDPPLRIDKSRSADWITLFPFQHRWSTHKHTQMYADTLHCLIFHTETSCLYQRRQRQQLFMTTMCQHPAQADEIITMNITTQSRTALNMCFDSLISLKPQTWSFCVFCSTRVCLIIISPPHSSHHVEVTWETVSYVSKHMDISESPELLGAAESLMLFNGVPFSHFFSRQAKALKK